MRTRELRKELRYLLKGYIDNPDTCGHDGIACQYIALDKFGETRRCVVGQFFANHGVDDESLQTLHHTFPNSKTAQLFARSLVGNLDDGDSEYNKFDLFVRAQRIHDSIAEGHMVDDADLGAFNLKDYYAKSIIK